MPYFSFLTESFYIDRNFIPTCNIFLNKKHHDFRSQKGLQLCNQRTQNVNMVQWLEQLLFEL